LLGEILPLDPAAPPIRFEANLPEQWNGKAVQYGGGGLNGVLITGLDPLRDARLDTPGPVARGFSTWGTDSGHDNAKLPEIQAFALNSEALENYAYASYKKVRDVAVEIARVHYGTAPRRVYYYGGSEGGREGLTMAQRFPADFDGNVSAVPAINFTGLQAAGARNGIALMGNGWLSPAKVKTLHKAVLDGCDTLDGLADGIVSRYGACRTAFDPKKLRCPDGRDSENCLTDVQIAAVEAPSPLPTGSRPFQPTITGARISRAVWWRGSPARSRRSTRYRPLKSRAAYGITAPASCATLLPAIPILIRANSGRRIFARVSSTCVPCAAIRNGHATWAARRRTRRAFRASEKAISAVPIQVRGVIKRNAQVECASSPAADYPCASRRPERSRTRLAVAPGPMDSLPRSETGRCSSPASSPRPPFQNGLMRPPPTALG
jgi:hypothetical protein